MQEAYDTHREAYFAKQYQAFTMVDPNPVTADQALIQHLARLRKLAEGTNGTQPSVGNDLDNQDVNCCVVWARPAKPVAALIQDLQQRLVSLVGRDFHVIPTEDIHLSVIELSHRHSVPHLRSVVEKIGLSLIHNVLDLVSTVNPKPGLIAPQLSFDKMGIALNFLPSAEAPYTYHHLRSDMHALALESGVSIDMCYTAPSAHVTLGRFVGNAFFEEHEARKRFLRLVEGINHELKAERSGQVWRVGEDEGLELQLGYLKFGANRKQANIIGKH